MSNNFVKDLIEKMSIEQKIGSLFTFGFCGTTITPINREAILKYHCGGFRISPAIKNFGSYVSPESGKALVNIEPGIAYKQQMPAPYVTASQYKDIIAELQEVAAQRDLNIPLHLSYDSEGGGAENHTIGKYIRWQSQMGLRAADDPEFAYKTAYLAGKQAKAMGLTLIHSPVLDINVCPENPGCGVRSFSDRAEEVAIYAEEAARGYIDAGVIPTGKHFPNIGGNDKDSHFDLIRVTTDRETMMKRDLLPYRELIKKDLLPAIMPAHNIYEAFDSEDVATVSSKILKDLLRDELGFKGVVTTDSMTMAGVAAKYGIEKSCALALQAGADLVLMKADNHLNGDCFESVLRFVQDGKISEREIDKKVERVLSMKERFGLFGAGAELDGSGAETPEEERRGCPVLTPSNVDPDAMFADPEVIELNSILAKKTTLIESDKKGLLPLNKEQKILLIEQERPTPNDIDSHSAMLYKKCLQETNNLSYLEVAYSYDKDDVARIREAVKSHDLIVMTNFYSRGTAQNCDIVDEIASDKSKDLILITNTPYPTSIPESTDTVIITFGQETANLAFVAKMLFGKETPEGVWPIEYFRFDAIINKNLKNQN